MRILDELDYVMREFVSFEEVFTALCKEQEIDRNQAKSWFKRNISKLNSVKMIDCNLARRDYAVGDEHSWAADFLYDDNDSESFDWTLSDNGEGYVAGWIASELQEFFISTRVDYPGKTILALRESRSANSGTTIAECFEKFSETTVPSELDLDEKPVGTRERTSLLVIIAALANEANLPIISSSKSADMLASMTERMGAPVAKRTIEEHLKRIPDAMERKNR